MELTIEKAQFAKTSLEQISEALKKGLQKNYKLVEISIVDCPNLKQWDCPAEGLSGNQKIIDVGGEPYMHDKSYYFEDIYPKASNLSKDDISWFRKILCARCWFWRYVMPRWSLR